RPWWHLERLQCLPCPRIDAPDRALVPLPGSMPELAPHPGHAGDEAVGLDRPDGLSGFGVDLMDLSVPILADPERPFRPREPRGAAGGRRDRGHHVPGLGVDLLDPIAGDLKQVAAVERRSRMRGNLERPQLLAR